MNEDMESQAYSEPTLLPPDHISSITGMHAQGVNTFFKPLITF